MILRRLSLFVLCMPLYVFAAEPPAVMTILERMEQAFYYPGADMKTNVTMDLITADGKRRKRVLTMLRKNDPKNRNQKYFLYFHEPGDVRRIAFLAWKYPEKDDDRWIFIPAVNMVRRVAARDSRSSFVGSDFTYEDVSGRDLSADTHRLLREESLNGVDCYVIESVPNKPAEYTKKLTWIDKATFLPRKEDYFDAQNEVARVFTADKIDLVTSSPDKKAYPTVTKRTIKTVKTGHRTEVEFSNVLYNVGLDDALFAEHSLQNPPQKAIQ